MSDPGIGVLVGGGIIASGFIAASLIKLDRPVVAWLLGMSAAALLVAAAATAIGEVACSSSGEIGRCREDDQATEHTYDGDWHGWPVGWRTDMSEYWQQANDWDETYVIVVGAGVSLPLLIISLGVWFATAFVIEGVVIALWRTVRRVRVHGTLFASA